MHGSRTVIIIERHQWRRLEVPKIRRLWTSLKWAVIAAHTVTGGGWRGCTVGRQTPHLSRAGRSRLPTWRGEDEDTQPARASLLLTSSRGVGGERGLPWWMQTRETDGKCTAQTDWWKGAGKLTVVIACMDAFSHSTASVSESWPAWCLRPG